MMIVESIFLEQLLDPLITDEERLKRIIHFKKGKEKVESRKFKQDFLQKLKLQAGCYFCGYNNFNGALEFHHPKSESKEFSIGHTNSFAYSWEKIAKELNKCIIVCVNCHRELHAGEK